MVDYGSIGGVWVGIGIFVGSLKCLTPQRHINACEYEHMRIYKPLSHYNISTCTYDQENICFASPHVHAWRSAAEINVG